MVESTMKEYPIVTSSAALQKVLQMANRVADSSAAVLIHGESGTGKELLAKYIHYHSERSSKPFVAMNCAALPEHLAESELFGYEKGAFTGAYNSRIGKFELAHQGTLLLDEISEMPLSLQVKILRILQEKEVDHIGGRQPIAVDVRILATTNRDLKQMVINSEFRQDLYYRLSVVPMMVPPLRDRKEDIVLLANFFIEKYCPQYRKPQPQFSPEAVSMLMDWQWPGNVRELENTVQRAVLLSEGAIIDKEFLLLDHEMTHRGISEKSLLVGMTVKEMEQKLIDQTLQHVNQNRTNAAKMLGISIRTLRNKLNEYQQLASEID